jgi:urea transport system permease protein
MRRVPLLGPTGWIVFRAAALVAVVLIPLMATVPAEGSAFRLPAYLVPLFGKYLCYAILALALDLIWGYAGILSLGHGAFFALGGYAMGMYLMRQIGTRGVYGNPVLPDFMVFLNWQKLPIAWWGFDNFAYAAFMALAVPGVLAVALGWFAFRSRVTGVYLSIITQAMTYALLLAFFRNDMGFGGNNGLTDFKEILGYEIQAPSTRLGLYIVTAVALGLSFLICRFVVTTRYGRLLLALRDAESRVRFLGYSTTGAKLFVFTLSALLCGLAGALYVPQIGIINPSEFQPGNSIEVAIWVAVGGRGTLVGAILGALVVNFVKTWLTGAAPELWLFALGALFIVVTLAMPQGILGLAAQMRRWRGAPAAPPAAPSAVKETAHD